MEDTELKQALEHILDDFFRDGKFRIKGIDHTYSDPIVIIKTDTDIDIAFYLLGFSLSTGIDSISISFVVPGYRKVAKWMDNDKIYLEDVFNVIGIDTDFLKNIVTDDIDEIASIMRVIKNNWPRITEAFDRRHRTTTFLKICDEVRRHSHPEDVMTKEETVNYIKSLLKDFTMDGEFAYDSIRFGFGFIDIFVATNANVWIEFDLERRELLYNLIAPDYGEIAKETGDIILFNDLFPAIGLDYGVFPRTLAEHLDGIPIIMRIMKDNWPRISQAFYPEYRVATFQKVTEQAKERMRRDFGHRGE
jgi:hypothetical protein